MAVNRKNHITLLLFFHIWVNRTEGSVIPKDACVLLLFDRMNRDPEIWGDDVNVFNPNRFLPELVAKRHPWSFLPYSGGPRNCIGKCENAN